MLFGWFGSLTTTEYSFSYTILSVIPQSEHTILNDALIGKILGPGVSTSIETLSCHFLQSHLEKW